MWLSRVSSCWCKVSQQEDSDLHLRINLKRKYSEYSNRCVFVCGGVSVVVVNSNLVTFYVIHNCCHPQLSSQSVKACPPMSADSHPEV